MRAHRGGDRQGRSRPDQVAGLPAGTGPRGREESLRRPVRVTPALGVLLALLVPAAATGQVPWDSPLFVAPNSPAGLGIFLVEYDFSRQDDLGVMAMIRPQEAPGGMGYRFGVAEGFNDELAAFGGVDFSGVVADASDDFPLQVIWVAGFGGAIGDYLLISAPAGLALGKILEGEGAWFNPYISGRVVLDASLGDESPRDDDLSLDFGVDVGLDFGFDDDRDFVIRFAANLGDRQSLAIGVNTALSRGRRRDR